MSFSRVMITNVLPRFYETQCIRRSGMAGVNDRPQIYLPPTRLIHKWNGLYLLLLPSRRAAPHFGLRNKYALLGDRDTCLKNLL